MEKRIESRRAGRNGGKRRGRKEEECAHPGTPGLRSTTDLLYSRLYEMERVKVESPPTPAEQTFFRAR